MSLPFRFGVNMLTVESKAAWIEKCRKAEDLGFDVISVPDHLGLPAPFPAMMLAAQVTERAHVNSFVLNVPFYNPVLLAREAITLDALTDGRVELGLGAGYVKAEFDSAGIAFPGAGRRVDQVAEFAATLRSASADPQYQPQPARPGGPRLLIAGWGDRLLRVAAEHADIVAFTGGSAADSGLLTAATPQELDKRVAYVRGLLGDRAASTEFNILLQAVAGPGERDVLRARLITTVPEGGQQDIEELPTVLAGTPEQMADQLRERRERFGISYFTTLEPSMDALAKAIELVR
ncbi:TIGR03621 family F420-dependent LLM class oxidoreductase [Nocardia sp. NEAU-G5]|uniref:TIGR03621 family F420-dependent LLM class oxidoreductase n=1 Tax=Nocardia albiluteola TaxID=2842303 RepID=A0ABS6B5J4_9NOCA|nr:TIGR03621 family F420-dependent LLM class oxidoreductase [Nocardia albiluteola]MBU3064676.1 TIGR03621 family F420-dependent LLM class oxidoreductase [Nocardia albiluteola]